VSLRGRNYLWRKKHMEGDGLCEIFRGHQCVLKHLPQSLSKDNLKLNTPKQGKHYRKILNGNSTVKMAKND